MKTPLAITAAALFTQPLIAAPGDVLYRIDAVNPAALFSITTELGSTVAIDGDYLVVGETRYGSSGFGFGPGRTAVYQLSTGALVSEFSDPAYNDNGWFVDISGGTVITTYAGSASPVFLFDAATGAQLHELRPSDYTLGSTTVTNGLIYGRSVAIDGDIAAIATVANVPAQGAAPRLYINDVATGAENLRIDEPAGAIDFAIGIALANGRVATMGSDGTSSGGPGDNGTYNTLFIFDTATGAETARVPLVPDDFGQYGSNFSNFQFLDGDGDHFILGWTIIDAATGNKVKRLIPDDGLIAGAYASINGNYAIITRVAGASGGAFIFDVATGEELSYTTAPVPSSTYPQDVAIGSGYAAVGDSLEPAGNSTTGTDVPGAVYVIESPPAEEPCLPDLNGDGILDNGDIITFVSLFLAGDTAADINGDGILDNGDIITFVAVFLAGC